MRSFLLRGALRAGLATVAIALGGCGGSLSFGGAGPLRIASSTSATAIQPFVTTSAYRYIDANTVDIILSDLPESELRRLGSADSDLVGNIVHIHMFLYPRAGRTPIEFSASNVSVRHVILAPGAAGVYAGGGFFLPSNKPGGKTLSGVVREATLRLSVSRGAFADRLGSTELSGSISASRNDDLVRDVELRLISMLPARREGSAPETPVNGSPR